MFHPHHPKEWNSTASEVKFNADGVNGRLANSHWDFSSIKQTHLNFLLADIFILFLFSAVRT